MPKGYSPISVKEDTFSDFRQLQRVLAATQKRDVSQDEMLRLLLDCYEDEKNQKQKQDDID